VGDGQRLFRVGVDGQEDVAVRPAAAQAGPAVEDAVAEGDLLLLLERALRTAPQNPSPRSFIPFFVLERYALT